MVAFFKKYFTGEQKEISDEISHADSESKLKIATCAVLLEIANSDDEFSGEERIKIIDILREKFDLSDDEAHELIEISQGMVEKSIDIYGFTKTINGLYSVEEKLKVLEAIWEVIYIDGHLSGHEDSLVHKLAVLLGLKHQQLIDSKLKVLGDK
ncbi:MAG: TerB family tellurite resistance protein [candidate division Zixibacteria bacterium]